MGEVQEGGVRAGRDDGKRASRLKFSAILALASLEGGSEGGRASGHGSNTSCL